MSLQSFTTAYIECALWSSTDHNDNPLDDGEHDLSSGAEASMQADCATFYSLYGSEIDDDTNAGHDFWLTRNGHGAGFWDGDWPEPLASRLTQAAKSFGEVNLYVGDDGLIYLS